MRHSRRTAAARALPLAAACLFAAVLLAAPTTWADDPPAPPATEGKKAAETPPAEPPPAEPTWSLPATDPTKQPPPKQLPPPIIRKKTAPLTGAIPPKPPLGAGETIPGSAAPPPNVLRPKAPPLPPPPAGVSPKPPLPVPPKVVAPAPWGRTPAPTVTAPAPAPAGSFIARIDKTHNLPLKDGRLALKLDIEFVSNGQRGRDVYIGIWFADAGTGELLTATLAPYADGSGHLTVQTRDLRVAADAGRFASTLWIPYQAFPLARRGASYKVEARVQLLRREPKARVRVLAADKTTFTVHGAPLETPPPAK